jgi:hypothetical protein
MKINEIFVRDYADKKNVIDPVIQVTREDPEKIFQDLDEYVITPEIDGYLRKFLDLMLESRSGPVNKVCAWVSGFFGSGKSHFVKVLGNILKDRPIIDKMGSKYSSTQFFCAKHNLNYDKILTKEFHNEVFFIHMLDHPYDKQWSISSIIYATVLDKLGYSTVFWIAEIEQILDEEGLFETFQKEVEKEFNQPWKTLRTQQHKTRAILIKLLPKIDPKTYASEKAAEDGIQDAKDSFSLTPSLIVSKLIHFAEKMDKQKGRIVLVLDEMSIYIAKNSERLQELDIFTEKVESTGKGKLWLLCTAQEALNEVIKNADTQKKEYFWLNDRFQMKFQLTPGNINTVVKKRLLEKKTDKNVEKNIKTLFSTYQGTFLQATQIPNATHSQDLFMNFKVNDFCEYYPLLPYHIYLMQEIFGLLRAKGEISQKMTGRERAVLLVVDLLIKYYDSSTAQPFYNFEIGELVTFDRVFDIIDEELKAIDSKDRTNIVDQISKLGLIDGLRIDSVAKALFLLQQVEIWLPSTIDNIAAVLYPKMGFDRNLHVNRVKECLETLEKNNWIKTKDNQYHFLSTFERTFKQVLQEQIPSETEKQTLIKEILNNTFKKSSGIERIHQINYQNTRILPIQVTADNDQLTNVGELKIEIYTPYLTINTPDLESNLHIKSIAESNSLLWISEADEEFEQMVSYKISLQKAIGEFERKNTPKDQKVQIEEILRDAKNEQDVIVQDRLPSRLIHALERGKYLIQGKTVQLDGTKAFKEIFKEQIEKLADDLFPEFISLDKVRINEEKDIDAMLKWKGGALKADIFSQLKLFDATKKEILPTTKIPAKIINEIRQAHAKNEKMTGKDLIAKFQSPPYGWDEKIVRFAITALFKNGTVFFESSSKPYFDPTSEDVLNAFKGTQLFNKIVLKLGEDITPEQRNQLSTAISDIFKINGGQTIEEIDTNLLKVLTENIERIKKLHTIAEQNKLPFIKSFKELQTLVESIVAISSRNQRLIKFLEITQDDTFKKEYELYLQFDKFESDNHISMYNRIKEFCKLNQKSLESIQPSGSPIIFLFNSVDTDLQAEEFISRWSNISGNFLQIQKNFESNYATYHQKRNDQSKIALKEIEEKLKSSGKSINDLSSKIKTNFQKLEKFQCAGADLLTSIQISPFKCNICSSSLNDLINNNDLIDAYKQSIITSILQEESKPEDSKKGSNKKGQKTGDKYQIAFEFLENSQLGGVKGLLSQFIDQAKIKPEYEKAFEIINRFIPQRIIVSTNQAKSQAEDLLNNSECEKVYITSLEDSQKYKEDIPDDKAIVDWAYNIIPLSDSTILPIIQRFLGKFLVVKDKANRDRLFKTLKLDMVTLQGEFQDSSGDILAGK